MDKVSIHYSVKLYAKCGWKKCELILRAGNYYKH